MSAQVSELVAYWQEQRANGRRLSPEELCAAHPELLADVRPQIEALSAMESLLGVRRDVQGDASTPQPERPTPDGGLFPAEAAPSGTAARCPAVPGYEILGELGRGGMGVVYKARQTRLNRLVALKMIRDSEYAGPRELARFRSEAEAVAALQHPNIVQIHEIGEQEGCPFFCLEYLEGGSLAQHAAGKPQRAGDAARLVEILARAMQAAHERGVVHRDLKPGNILLTADGTPKIADFGLARRLQADARQTRSGEALGTPAYMAPEQASGKGSKDVGPAADLYALGVILYELLTGRPPFQAESGWDTLVQVLSHEPVPPSRLQPTVPRDLETVCLKCLEKAPHKRYASALELAEDLHRFLAGEPIRARPAGFLERVGKWARRRPAIAALLAAVVLVAAAGISGIVWKWQDAEYNRGEAEAAQGRAETNAARERAARERATLLAGRLDEELQNTQANLYVTRIQLAHRSWLANEPEAAENLLDACVPGPGQPDLRGWEWYYLKHLCRGEVATCQGQPEGLHSVCFSADGKRLVACTLEGVVHEWDAQTGKEVSAFPLNGHSTLVTCVAFSKDGKVFASGSGDRRMVPKKGGVEFRPGEVKIWDAESRKVLRTLPHPGAVFAVAFSPDGTLLASPFTHWTKPSSVILWDAQTGAEVRRWPCGAPAYCVAFSPDGQHVAAGCDNGTVRVWAAVTGKAVFTARHAVSAQVRSVAFSPDGQRLASADLEGSVRVWDVPGGEQLLLLPSARRFVVFSPDGQRLATEGPEGTLAVWDAKTGEQLLGLRGRHACAAFSPDGKRIASAAEGRSVKVWDARNPPESRVLRGYSHPLTAIAFSSDGQRLAAGTGNLSDETKVWDTASWELALRVPARGLVSGGLAFSPDGKRLATASWDRKPARGRAAGMQLWDAADGTEIPLAPDTDCTGGFLGPDGRTVAIRRRDGLTVADFPAGRVRFTLPGCGQGGAAFSPDGRLLAAARQGGDVVVCDATTGQEICTLAGAGAAIQTVERSLTGATYQGIAWSRDRKQLAVRAAGGKLTVWDLTTRKERSRIEQAGMSFAFSADGKRIASAGLGAVRLWDTKTGREVLTLRGHRDQVTVVGFSPEGQTLVSGGADATIRVWNAQPVGPASDEKR